MVEHKISNLDITFDIFKHDSNIIAKYNETTIHGVSDYDITATQSGDYEITLKFLIKAPLVVTHSLAAKKEDLMP